MVVFLVQRSHSYTHEQLAGRTELGTVQCRSYDWILGHTRIPPATYVFTDRERMDSWELRVLAALYTHLRTAGPGYRVLNDPARMLGRRALLRALFAQGLNRFNAYAASERVSPAQFPVFLRREYDHAQPLTGLLYNAAELQTALAQLRRDREPEEGLLIIEYCGQPVDGDLYRKLSAYRIGDRTFFYNTAHERSWLVKYGTLNAATDALYREEQAMIRDNAFQETVTRAFDIAGMDYGRADFGLVDGAPQIYEINSNPFIKPPGEHPNPIRQYNHNQSWSNYCFAVNALDTANRRAPAATAFEHPALYWRRRGVRELVRPRILR